MTKAYIFDFETMSTIAEDGVVLSCATLLYDEERIRSDDPYTYEELLDNTSYIKFDVEDQVKVHNRTFEQDTIEWWKQQGSEARKVLQADPNVDVSISELDSFIVNSGVMLAKKVYSRGKLDPDFIESIYQRVLKKPYPYPHWKLRDTRTMIEGMAWPETLDNTFMPDGLKEKFVHHDPRHDITLDVMRMQTIAQALK